MEKRRFLAAIRRNGTIVACDQQGNEHTLTIQVEESVHTFRYREDPRSCSVQDILIILEEPFLQLCANLKTHTESQILIESLRYSSVEIEDDHYHSSVFLGGDGRWKCTSSRCKARNHFKCEHARFVGLVVPVDAVADPPRPGEDYSDLIETY